MNPRRRDLIDPVDAMDHIRGPLHAPVTIVEYGDFECPTCRQATGALKILFDRYPEQIRLVFRHYPLESVHPHALMAALASEAAASQGKFWRMHDALFANQNHLDMKHLRAYARDIGLDVARFVADMDDTVYLQRVREHIESGKRNGIRATPTFFVNGVIADVSFGMASLADAVARELDSYARYPSVIRVCP